MNNIAANNPANTEQIYFLTQFIGIKVIFAGKRIGKLSDFLIIDKDKIAEVTHLYVARPFGDKTLVIPWEKVKSIDEKEAVVDIENIEKYEGEPADAAVLLKDHIMDKRVLDVEDREVEVVYDVKMAKRGGKLYVIDVDLSKYGLLRRVGLKWLADFLYSLAYGIRNQTIAWDYVQPLPEKLSSFNGDIKLKVLKEKLSEMPTVDLADILEELDHNQRVAVFNELDTEKASDTLEELDPKVQRDMIASLKKERAAQLINEMTPGQAADLLSVLPWWEIKSILKLLTKETADKIQSILQQQEEKIIDFSSLNYLNFSPETTVEQVRRGFQRAAKNKSAITYIYVVDAQGRLLGVIDLSELLRAEPEALLKDIMTENVICLSPESTLKEASEMFARYGFRALPIKNKDEKMMGIIPYRDVMNLKHLFI
jgi:magnesium transporter